MESPEDPLDDCTSVNATILEYYNRFGRDRRLEKYLRLQVPIPARSEDPDDVAGPAPVVTVEGTVRSEEHQCKAVPIDAVTDSSQTDVDTLDESQQLDDSKISRTSKKSERRLEWDSLGDVGYNVQPSTSSDPNIKSIESDILKKLFTSAETAGPSTVEVSVKQKENWQRTLENIKHKYDTQLLDVSELGSVPFHTASFSDKSTPKPPLGPQQQSMQPPSSQPSLRKLQKGDKSVQTSLRDLSCKQIQTSIGQRSETSSISGMSSTVSTPAILKESRLSFATSRSSTSLDDVAAKSKTMGKMPNDLELGINLLCTLIESKNLSTRKKKLLARKIVSKISRNSSTSADSKTTTVSSTNSDQLNNNKAATAVGEKVSTISSPGDVNANTERSKISSTTAESFKCHESKQTSPASTTTSSSGVETQRQVKQKPKARSSSESMSAWLDPMTKSELKYEKHNKPGVVLVNKKATGDFVPATKSPTPVAEPVAVAMTTSTDFIPLPSRRRPSEILNFLTNERRAHLNWIENEVQHLENLKQLLLSDIKKTDFVPTTSRGNVYDDVARSTALSSARSSSARSTPREIEPVVAINEPSPSPEVQNEVIYDDVANTGPRIVQRHIVKSQSLDIPGEKKMPKRNCHSVDRHAEKQLRSKLETPTICTNENIAQFVRSRKQQFLERCNKKTYSNPSSSTDNGHYSEPCEKSEVSKQKPSCSEPCSSTTSSNFFVSSESMSVPEVTSSTTTTTHQYDHRTGIGIQTTESLMYTQKIVRPTTTTEEVQPTIRTYSKAARNKQTQTKPQSFAYVINFDKAGGSSGCAEEFTLRDYLEKRRPDFMEHSNQRNVILKKLHYLRKERDRQVREIVANSSINSLPRKLKELPPPPLKSTKIVPSREMKAASKQKYAQLPEVVERMRLLKVEKSRKTNRVLVDIFNKRMQQRVRKGRLNLEHSMTVI